MLTLVALTFNIVVVKNKYFFVYQSCIFGASYHIYNSHIYCLHIKHIEIIKSKSHLSIRRFAF